jgi:hypothetical protein
MLTTQQVVERIRGCSESQLRAIHEATKVPVGTLAKIRYGVTLDPRGSTVDALRMYFADKGEIIRESLNAIPDPDAREVAISKVRGTFAE